MNSVDKQYLELLQFIIDNGKLKRDRTGTGTISVFDYTMRFNMDEGFPLLTSKKMFTKGIIHEIIWFLKGDTNIKYLVENDVHIWDGDAYKKYKTQTPESDLLTKDEFIAKIKSDTDFANHWGELGPVYGKQWRDWGGHSSLVEVGAEYFGGSFGGPVTKMGGRLEKVYHKGVDQIEMLINDLKNNPDSRRLMVSAWNVDEIDRMTLPPCHYGFQCYTVEMTFEERLLRWCNSNNKSIHYGQNVTSEQLDILNFPTRKLSLKWTQRSVDTFLGLPFNIASYAFLLHLLAREVNMIPSELIFSGGDVHLYSNHVEQAKEQIKRETFRLPSLELKNDSLSSLKFEDFELKNYISSKSLKAELSN